MHQLCQIYSAPCGRPLVYSNLISTKKRHLCSYTTPPQAECVLHYPCTANAVICRVSFMYGLLRTAAVGGAPFFVHKTAYI